MTRRERRDLRYCLFDPDPRGNPRWYVRKRVNGRFRKLRIKAERKPGAVPSRDFMEAYWAALAELDGLVGAAPQLVVPREETFAWLWDQYQRSAAFRAYDKATQADKTSVLGRWVKPLADRPFRRYRQSDVEASQQKRATHPTAANKLVKYLRVFFKWALGRGHLDHNPALGVDMLPAASGGWHTWTEDEIARYRKHHVIGTQARLALELFLQVGARISDAAVLGRQHEYEHKGKRWIGFTATKNRVASAVRIDQPLLPAFLEALRACALVGKLTYLVTERGVPFTVKGLGNKMRDWCDAAGLQHCSAHGLRKASATAHAEAGATAHQLMAWFGWKTIRMAEVYTRAAEARRVTEVNPIVTALSSAGSGKSVSRAKSRETFTTKSGGKSNG